MINGHTLAIARDKFFNEHPNISKDPAVNPYLKNRIELAFLEGARFAENYISINQSKEYTDDHPIKIAISIALDRAGGMREEAAELLGWSPRKMYRKLKEHGFPLKHERQGA